MEVNRGALYQFIQLNADASGANLLYYSSKNTMGPSSARGLGRVPSISGPNFAARTEPA